MARDLADARGIAELKQRQQVRAILFFFFMKQEAAKEEALASFGLCDYMRTVEARTTRSTEPTGGREILVPRCTEPQASMEGSIRAIEEPRRHEGRQAGPFSGSFCFPQWATLHVRMVRACACFLCFSGGIHSTFV